MDGETAQAKPASLLSEGASAADLARLRAVPKVELHLHLEGAIPHDALFSLIQKYGGDPAVRRPADIAARFRFRDFPHFIAMWIWKNGFLRAYEDFTLIAEAMAHELVAENVKYAEVFFSPARFQGLAPAPLTKAIRDGLDRVPAVEVALIPDLVRDLGPEQAMAMLDPVAEVAREAGIVGIGMGGSEHAYPPEPFAAAFARARALGLRTTVHAGEAAGADSIRGALDALQAERIGHGLRAEEDPGPARPPRGGAGAAGDVPAVQCRDRRDASDRRASDPPLFRPRPDGDRQHRRSRHVRQQHDRRADGATRALRIYRRGTEAATAQRRRRGFPAGGMGQGAGRQDRRRSRLGRAGMLSLGWRRRAGHGLPP